MEADGDKENNHLSCRWWSRLEHVLSGSGAAGWKLHAGRLRGSPSPGNFGIPG